jgi:hypothetical protein
MRLHILVHMVRNRFSADTPDKHSGWLDGNIQSGIDPTDQVKDYSPLDSGRTLLTGSRTVLKPLSTIHFQSSSVTQLSQ